MSTQMAPPRGGGPGPVVVVVVGAVVAAAVLAAVIALLAASGDGDSPEGARRQPVPKEEASPAEGSGDAGEAAGDPGFDSAVAGVEGAPLPELTGADDDPAVGMPAPRVTGLELDGSTLAAPADGRPTMMVFLAHWCPHCQAEVEEVTDWLADGGLPEDVDLVAVATSITSQRPNHPPSDWLAGEGWDRPAIADADQSAAAAYGLTNLPYWVIVDADGDVVERRAGSQSRSEIEDMVESARSG